jgi:ribosome-binding protein aMBF1 (putative translation factor)
MKKLESYLIKPAKRLGYVVIQKGYHHYIRPEDWERFKKEPNIMALKLGEIIRSARKQAGLTQVQLGFECGTTGSWLSQVEKAERDPKMYLLFELAQKLNIPLFDNIWEE